MRFNPGGEPAVLSSGTAAKFTLPSVTIAAWENEKYASAWSARTNGSKRMCREHQSSPSKQSSGNKDAEGIPLLVRLAWSHQAHIAVYWNVFSPLQRIPFTPNAGTHAHVGTRTRPLERAALNAMAAMPKPSWCCWSLKLKQGCTVCRNLGLQLILVSFPMPSQPASNCTFISEEATSGKTLLLAVNFFSLESLDATDKRTQGQAVEEEALCQK